MSVRDDLVAAWFTKVEHDQISAAACAEKGIYDTACFHATRWLGNAQQAAEKYYWE